MQKARIKFRNGDVFYTEIDEQHTPQSLGQRMFGGGYLICQENRWGNDKGRTLIVNLKDVYVIDIETVGLM